MKKAKILVPSLSLLCFSAVACVTGSVAWFSSVSNAHVATSSFAVKSLDGTMDISVYHGVGTKATLADATADQTIKSGENVIGYKGSDKIIVKPDTYTESSKTHDNVLTHGSFDSKNSKAYTVKPFSGDKTEYEAVTTDAVDKDHEASFQANDTVGYYHIFSFDMEFNYDFKGASTGKYNLFFDHKNSSMTRSTSATLDTAKGFRVAFLRLNSDKTAVQDWTVWSDLQSKTWGTGTTVNSKYVGIKSGTTIQTIDYDPADTGNLIYASDPLTKVTTSTGSAARKDCLGTFDASTSTSTLKIRVVAWYEGEDENVVNAATLSSVACDMNFYLKGYAA